MSAPSPRSMPRSAASPTKARPSWSSPLICRRSSPSPIVSWSLALAASSPSSTLRRRPRTRSCTPPFTDRIARKGTSYGIRHDHRIRQDGALVAQPQQVEPGTGRRRNRHCSAHCLCTGASWLCDDAEYLGLVRSISILGILGLGMGLIVISRSIDLSEIALMACPWGVALIANQHGLPPFWTAVLALVIAVAVGCINGFMVAFVEAPALFVTLATTLVVYGASYWISPVYVVYAPQDADALLFAGRGALFGIPMPIIVFAAAALVMHFFLSRTSTGRFIYAQGDNPEAAKLSGIALRPL